MQDLTLYVADLPYYRGDSLLRIIETGWKRTFLFKATYFPNLVALFETLCILSHGGFKLFYNLTLKREDDRGWGIEKSKRYNLIDYVDDLVS